MPCTYYIGCEAGLRQLENHLYSQTCRAARAYITGYHASKDDITVHAAFTNHPSPKYVYICQWYNHITDLLRIGGFFGKGSGVLVDTSASFPEARTMYFVVLDVKPYDAETDMQMFEEQVRSIQIEGLEWGESTVVPIGYGVSKLRFEMTILVGRFSEEDVEESRIKYLIQGRFCEEDVEEYVQGVNLVVCRPVN